MEKIKSRIAQRLQPEYDHLQIEGRVKSIYGIYRKVYMQGRAFEEKDDALRIVRNRLGDVSQVTGAECLAVYDAILAHLNREVCRRLSAARGVAQYLGEGRERFGSLPIADRMTVVLQAVRFLQCDGDGCDLSLIGGCVNSGKIRYNKNIGDHVIELIHRSPCGLREVRRRV